MKIATWNLQSDKSLTSQRESALQQAMEGEDADVWVVTETWVDFPPAEGYRLVVESEPARDLDAWPTRRWVAIWAKPDVLAHDVEVLGQRDRMVCGRIQRPGKRAMMVVGTVLPWPRDQHWRGADGFCAALAIQSAEWERLRKAAPDDHSVIAGDFNQAIPYRRYYGSRKAGRALDDALRKLKHLCLTQGNDPLTRKPRIDHICVSPDGLDPSRLPSAGTWQVPVVGKTRVSDHSGVCVEHDWP